MTKRPNKEDVEKLSLEFAKEMIDFSDGGENAMIRDEVIERATRMAIDWLEGVNLRERMLEQLSPNWIDLAEFKEAELHKFDLKKYQDYWFIARPLGLGDTGPLELIMGTFVEIDTRYDPDNRPNAHILKDDRFDYLAQYFIPKEDALLLNQDFEPLPPKGVIVKNNKFSMTMTEQD